MKYLNLNMEWAGCMSYFAPPANLVEMNETIPFYSANKAT
jgi:hypothetical protein